MDLCVVGIDAITGETVIDVTPVDLGDVEL